VHVTLSLLRTWAHRWLIKALSAVLRQLYGSVDSAVQKYGLVCAYSSTDCTSNEVMCIKYEDIHTRSKLDAVVHCCEE
jgi:hypothetical protein